MSSGADSVPVTEEGDHPPAPAFAPSAQPPAADPERRSRGAAAAEVPTHEVTGTPPNPKRGWWRRVIDS